ncbi:MAG: plasmid pRiA4b ORF-3 family protein [Candidatus Cryptobacteroides sp.]
MYRFGSNGILQSLVTPLKDEGKGPKEYIIEISLDEAPVRVTRKLSVPSNLYIGHFVNFLLIAMGWERYHLSELTQGDVIWRSTKEKAMDKRQGFEYEDLKVKNSYRATVSQLLKKAGDECHLLYDMGDSWRHTIRLLEVRKYSSYVIAFDSYGVDLVGGEGACPLEDCGGVDGYAEILRIIKDPDDPEYEHYSSFFPKDFDPAEIPDPSWLIFRLHDYERTINEVLAGYFER